MYSLYDRILGCMVTAGMGDAVGAPTEAMSYQEILAKYGRIEGFVDGSDNLIALGNKIGEITDDTSQMYEMILAVIRSRGNLSVHDAGNALLEWSRNWPRYYPRNAGPTARNVIAGLREGKDPSALGRAGGRYQQGTSNGAAMRIAGAGLCNAGNLEGAVRTAIAMTECSHATQIAYSAACAVACAIAEAVTENASIHSILKAAIFGARRGEEIGLKTARIAAGARFLPMLMKAIKIGYESENQCQAEQSLNDAMGIDSAAIQPAVAISIGLFVAADGDSINTILGGANIGGDTDTIACIAGMVAGAYNGYAALPREWTEVFLEANPGLNFTWAAEQLTIISTERKERLYT